MNNDALENQGRYHGVYERAEIVNGKPSWNNSVNALWYTPNGNKWVVGNLIDLGHNDTMMHNMYAQNTKTADRYHNQSEIVRLIDTIGRWKFWNGSKWTSSIDLNVSCKGTYSELGFAIPHKNSFLEE